MTLYVDITFEDCECIASARTVKLNEEKVLTSASLFSLSCSRFLIVKRIRLISSSFSKSEADVIPGDGVGLEGGGTLDPPDTGGWLDGGRMSGVTERFSTGGSSRITLVYPSFPSSSPSLSLKSITHLRGACKPAKLPLFRRTLPEAVGTA